MSGNIKKGQVLVSEAKTKEREEYIKWSALTFNEKKEQGLCLSNQAEAEYLKVSVSTLRHWRIIWNKENGITASKTQSEKEWDVFMKRLTEDAAREGATAPTRTLYAQLKGKMPKTSLDIKIGLSADERIRRMIDADRELEDFKQLQVGK